MKKGYNIWREIRENEKAKDYLLRKNDRITLSFFKLTFTIKI